MDDELWGRLHDAFSEDELADLTICCGMFLGMGRTLAVVGRARAGRAHPRLRSTGSTQAGRLIVPGDVWESEPERPETPAAPGQSAGQLSWVSPAAKASISWCATSSWYCTGGDFMK